MSYGADEKKVNSQGLTPWECIGLHLEDDIKYV